MAAKPRYDKLGRRISPTPPKPGVKYNKLGRRISPAPGQKRTTRAQGTVPVRAGRSLAIQPKGTPPPFTSPRAFGAAVQPIRSPGGPKPLPPASGGRRTLPPGSPGKVPPFTKTPPRPAGQARPVPPGRAPQIRPMKPSVKRIQPRKPAR